MPRYKNHQLLRSVPLVARCSGPGRKEIVACAERQADRFTIRARDGQQIVADELVVTDAHYVHFRNTANLTVGHTTLSDIDAVEFGPQCLSEASERAPSGFCVERQQFAANFSYDNPLENRILTRGISYYLEFADKSVSRSDADRAAVGAEVRGIVSSGLMVWFSAMQDFKSDIDPAVAQYLKSIIATSSGGYSLLTPPQVIALECRQAATFIVRIYDQSATGPFAITRTRGRVKLALSQTPGRTIALNYEGNCWKQSYGGSLFVAVPRARGCLNGTALLAHELGHAFGLQHVNDTDSIMRDPLQVTKPSRADVIRLSGILRKSIDGGRPGELTFVASEGVELDCAGLWTRLYGAISSSAAVRNRPLIDCRQLTANGGH